MNNKRDMVMAASMQYASEWLKDNPVKIEVLTKVLREKMDDWDPRKEVPNAVRETIIKTSADRAIRRRIEEMRSGGPWWARAH